MNAEEKAWKRVEDALWRSYRPHLVIQFIAMVVLGVCAIACFFKACHP